MAAEVKAHRWVKLRKLVEGWQATLAQAHRGVAVVSAELILTAVLTVLWIATFFAEVIAEVIDWVKSWLGK